VSRRILTLGLVAVAAVVAVVLVVTLRPTGGSARGDSGARITPSPTPSRALSAPLGKLAYTRNGVYVAKWDGTDPVRIAGGGGPTETATGPVRPADVGYGEAPVWSPDGRYLAYQGESHGASYRRILTITDARGHLLASFPREGWQIAWSPDSTRVAVWVRLGRTIGIFNVHGVREKLLTLPPGLMEPGDFDPLWSPDGSSLVVPSGVEIPLGGSTPRQLPAGDPRSHWGWWYSPDGSRAAFLGGSSQLVVAAADGSRARVLVPGEVGNAAWSPTGDRIAFDTSTSIGLTQVIGPSQEIGVADVASGKVTMLLSVGIGRVVGFSPDGRLVLFLRVDPQGMISLWSVRTDGSKPRRLVTGTEWGEWQPRR
jgi:Tol biopolymer transport system component